MKVVLVNHSDTLGGASVVTLRLMNALRAAGVDAWMLVTHKAGDSPYVVEAAPRWRAKLPFLAEHLQIFTGNGLNYSDLFKASIGTVGLPLSRHPLIKSADVVVLNWVNQGMLSLDEVRRIAAKKPVVWTMHDMWNMTGICHHAAKCEGYLSRCAKCELLHWRSGDNDLSAKTFDLKAKTYAASNIHFVAVSRWLADCARRSKLLGNQKVSVINNSFPIDELSAPAEFSRAELGLPESGKLILFCAARIDDPIKGLPNAIRALNSIQDRSATAIFVGNAADPHCLDSLHLPHRHLGPIYDKARLHAIFVHCDVVLSSSTYETMAATLTEGQAAGATPVSFVHDGRSDVVTDGLTGYAAGPLRTLAQAIDLALSTPISPDRLLEAARRYSCETIAEKYVDLFDSII